MFNLKGTKERWKTHERFRFDYKSKKKIIHYFLTCNEALLNSQASEHLKPKTGYLMVDKSVNIQSFDSSFE